jgi:hypothetical protein
LSDNVIRPKAMDVCIFPSWVNFTENAGSTWLW